MYLMLIYDLKITGNGTKREIINSLKTTLKQIEGCSAEELEDFSNEDPTLYTEIKTLEHEEAER
jgi:hypothetical protein